MKRILLICMMLFAASSVIFAGDIASFVDLGFSADAKYFMFAQYGINESSYPYAEIYTVNVATNKFVAGGVLKEEYKVAVNPGQEGLGALMTLMRKTAGTADTYGIHHLKTGRLVYVLLNGELPKETIQFRDFQTGNSFTLTLRQSVYGEDANISSSFFINAVIEKANGKVENYTVGLPDYKRNGVKEYLIRKILISPQDNALIFVIEKTESGKQGHNIRYMVETLSVY
jgi:predicted secreted protein